MRCRIREYDELPSRVGLYDVDYLRWRLYLCNWTPKYKLLKLYKKYCLPRSDEWVKEQVIMRLEKAYLKHRDGPAFANLNEVKE